MSQTAENSNWIDAWLETQRGWLGRWQATAMEQRVDGVRVAMETLRKHLNPADVSPEAMNVLQSFQTLLQSCMANASELSGMLGAAGDAANNPLRQMLDVFPLGPAREQQVAWQVFLKAQADYQLRLQAMLQLYAQVFTASLQAVPEQVEARAAQGKPVTGVRELYEVWIECGEQIFALQAHDPLFTAAQAACTNALSRLKLAQQTLLQDWLQSYDLPTRSELNSVHLRLRELGARVAELEQQLAASLPASGKPGPAVRKRARAKGAAND